MIRKKVSKHQLIAGPIQAQCSCGEWLFIGLLPEAKVAIKKLHKQHIEYLPDEPTSR